MRDTHARVQEAQIVRDLGHGSYCRTRRLGEGSLLDGNRGAQPVDSLYVRLRELLEKLPRVGAQRFDVASLTLGVDRIERERRLARTARSREDYYLAARQTEADILQVVLSCTDDDEAIQVGTASLARRRHFCRGRPRRTQRPDWGFCLVIRSMATDAEGRV